MKIDFDVVLTGIDGKELTVLVEHGKDPEPAKLSVVSREALLRSQEAPGRPVDGSEKFKRWELAKKVSAGGIIELKSEEVSKIKELIGGGYPVVIVGPSYEALEKVAET